MGLKVAAIKALKVSSNLSKNKFDFTTKKFYRGDNTWKVINSGENSSKNYKLDSNFGTLPAVIACGLSTTPSRMMKPPIR
jgi:hypothetical protein